jgi:hypothetical protein
LPSIRVKKENIIMGIASIMHHTTVLALIKQFIGNTALANAAEWKPTYGTGDIIKEIK